MQFQLLLTIIKLLTINICLMVITFDAKNQRDNQTVCEVSTIITFIIFVVLLVGISIEQYQKTTKISKNKYLSPFLIGLALINSLISQQFTAYQLDLLTFLIIGQIYKETEPIKVFNSDLRFKKCFCMIVLAVFGEVKIFQFRSNTGDPGNQLNQFMCWEILIVIQVVEPCLLYFESKQIPVIQSIVDNIPLPRLDNVHVTFLPQRRSFTLPQDSRFEKLINSNPFHEELISPLIAVRNVESAVIEIEARRTDKKQFFEALINQMHDGIAIFDLESNLEYFSQRLLQILETKDKQLGQQILMNLQNCQEQFEEQEIFNRLFDRLNVKLMVNAKDSAHTQNSIRSSYQAESDTVEEEIDKIVLEMTKQIGRLNQFKQTEYQNLFILYQVRMICQMNPDEEKRENTEEDGQTKRKTFLQIIFKPFIQFQKPYIMVIVEDVTMFNEISVLQQTNSNKSMMLAQVAHEFRTPLNGIILLTETQIEDCDDKQSKEVLKPILSSALWLLSLVNDILDLAQLNAGKFQLVHSQFDIQQELIDVASMMSVQTNSKGIELTIVVDPNIPKQITSDKRRIKQVIVNLLSNAIKFTPKGGTITIIANQICGKQFTEIIIKDSGVGIPTEEQGKLFMAFGKLEATNNLNSEGVGLGLMICNILSLKLSQKNTYSRDTTYGLQVSSEGQGKGSKFSFVILDQLQKPLEAKQRSSKLIIDSFLKDARTTSQNIQQRVNFKTDSPDYKAINSSVHFSACNDLKTKNTKGSRYIKLTTVNFKALNETDTNKLVHSFSIGSELKPLATRLSADFQKVNILSMVGSSPDIDSSDSESSQGEFMPISISINHECKQILIVDDVEINMIGLKFALIKNGYTCECAYDAIDALKQLRDAKECKNCFRIILMDIEMPKLNGIQATRMIRAELKDKNYHIIGCSGHSGEKDKQACLVAGMNDYIEKPIRAAELIKKLTEMAETHGL